MRLQGAAGPTNITVSTAGGTDQRASVALPGTLANGIYQVRLVLGDGASSATNPRQLQVVPLVTTPIGIATQVVNGRNVHRLTINGARLNGADVRLAIDTRGVPGWARTPMPRSLCSRWVACSIRGRTR